MSELTFTLLRLGYLVVLWLFVLLAVRVMRRDLGGSRPARPARGRGRSGKEHPRAQAPSAEGAVVVPGHAAASAASPALASAATARVPDAASPARVSVTRGAEPAGAPSGAVSSSGVERVRAGTNGFSSLLVTEGTLRGTSLPLSNQPVVIGRSPSCTLVLEDDYSSSRHARLFPQSGAWFVEDLGSTNGTYLGERRVDAPVVVRAGDRIRVGQTVMELQR